MYGQGYRNKADRKSNSRFVVSEKISPDTGRKKRPDTPKMKSESQVVVDVRSISQSPRRLRANIPIAQIKDLYSGYFALPGAVPSTGR